MAEAERYNPRCWLARHGKMEKNDPLPPCEGRLIRAHIVPQQLLNRLGLEAGDPRTYVLSCGGLSGVGGHHGMLDYSKKLRLAVADLPAEVLQFCEEHDLVVWLEKTYGRSEAAWLASTDNTGRAAVESAARGGIQTGSVA